MGNNSFLSKLLFVCAFVILLILITFFVINKGEADKNMKEIELITSVNADTYDKDMYIYDYDGTSISVSQYFYNKYYLQNHTVKYEKYNGIIKETYNKIFLIETNGIKKSFSYADVLTKNVKISIKS